MTSKRKPLSDVQKQAALAAKLRHDLYEVLYKYDKKIPLSLAIGVLTILSREIYDEAQRRLRDDHSALNK